MTDRAFNEAREVGFETMGRTRLPPGPAFIIRVVRHVLKHRGATRVAAVHRVRPVTGDEEIIIIVN